MEITQGIRQPNASEVRKFPTAYSFDDEPSAGSQPTTIIRDIEKLDSSAGRHRIVMTLRDANCANDCTPGKIPKKQLSHDQLWNHGALIISDDSSAEATSDEDERWMANKKQTTSRTSNTSGTRKGASISSSKPDCASQDGARAADAPIPLMSGRSVDTQTSDWERMGCL